MQLPFFFQALMSSARAKLVICDRFADVGRCLLNFLIVAIIVLATLQQQAWWSSRLNTLLICATSVACGVTVIRSGITCTSLDLSFQAGSVLVLTIFETALLSVVLTVIVRDHSIVDGCFQQVAGRQCIFLVSQSET